MSDTRYKMTGIFCIILSIFVLIGANYLKPAVAPSFVSPLCWTVGLILLTAGLLLYKVIKKEA